MAATKLLPAYLIIGTDELKRNRAVTRMKQRLEASGLADFNLDERDMGRGEADPEDLLSSLNTFPLGAEFRLVILDNCNRLPKAVSEMLVAYLKKPSETTVLMIIADKLAKNTRLYKAAVKWDKKALIDCAPKKRWELPAHVRALAPAHGKTITQAGAEELVSRVGESTRMLDNELKKLASIVTGPEITQADVEQYVVRTAEPKPWDFLDAVSARNAPKALGLLKLMPGKSDYMLYSLLATRLRELIYAKALDARGEGGMLTKTLGAQAWQVKNHLTWARRFKMGELVGALEAAVDVELALKGSRDAETALIQWVARICGR